jgi:hypothetical protein
VVFPQDKNKDPAYMSVSKAEKAYNVSESTLLRRAREGKLTKYKQKGRVYYKVSELNREFSKPAAVE